MITVRIQAEVKEDRRVEIVLPPETPLGQVELVVNIEPVAPQCPPRKFSLSEWAEKYSEDLGDTIRSDDVEGFTGRRF